MPIKMVWTRKSEGERDLDEIELATEKVSLASFFPLFSLPLFSFLSSQLLLSPPLPTSLFYPSCTSEYALIHPSLACSPRCVCTHASWKHVVRSKCDFYGCNFVLYIYIYTFPLEPALWHFTTLYPAKRDNLLKASLF